MATDSPSYVLRKNYSPEDVLSDEIMDELEAFREAYAAQFDYDIEKIFADMREFGKRNPVAPIADIKPAKRKPRK